MQQAEIKKLKSQLEAALSNAQNQHALIPSSSTKRERDESTTLQGLPPTSSNRIASMAPPSARAPRLAFTIADRRTSTKVRQGDAALILSDDDDIPNESWQPISEDEAEAQEEMSFMLAQESYRPKREVVRPQDGRLGLPDNFGDRGKVLSIGPKKKVKLRATQ